MYSISRIQRFLKLLPRGVFDEAVRRHEADRYCKSFKSWDQFVVMSYAQLVGAKSLRSIETGFNVQSNHHYHLGVGAVRRTTLADANSRRDPGVFADVVRALMSSAQRKVRRDCADLLYLMDSTTVCLKGRGFDEWAGPTRVRSTQGLKLHVVYEASAQVPCWQSMTATNVNDLTEGRKVAIEAGATYVFDKAYCDFNWWKAIDEGSARFVSRFKSNTKLKVLERRAVPAGGEILGDEIVQFNNPSPGAGRKNHYVKPLRRVSLAREGKPPLTFATNDLEAPAAEIASLYKARWGVELFFKWIKQNLNIKQFCSRNENAVRIQVLTAVITYLLLWLQKRQDPSCEKRLLDLRQELKAALFQREDVVPKNADKTRRRREIQQFKTDQAVLFTA